MRSEADDRVCLMSLWVIYLQLMCVQRSEKERLCHLRDDPASSSSYSAGYGSCTTSKHNLTSFFFLLPLSYHFSASFRWLLAVRYLKTSSACALTISEDGCWVISGKEVDSTVLPFHASPERSPRSNTILTATLIHTHILLDDLRRFQRMFSYRMSVMKYVAAVSNWTA